MLFCGVVHAVLAHTVENIADEGLEAGLDMLHDDTLGDVGVFRRQLGGRLECLGVKLRRLFLPLLADGQRGEDGIAERGDGGAVGCIYQAVQFAVHLLARGGGGGGRAGHHQPLPRGGSPPFGPRGGYYRLFLKRQNYRSPLGGRRGAFPSGEGFLLRFSTLASLWAEREVGPMVGSGELLSGRPPGRYTEKAANTEMAAATAAARIMPRVLR